MIKIHLVDSPLGRGRLRPEALPGGGGFVKKIVTLAAHHEKKIKGEVEVNIVGDKKIKSLNSRFRGKDRVTDVLSFSWLEDHLNFPSPNRGSLLADEAGAGWEYFLGQIYICYPQIVRQAREYGVPVKEEFARMLTHGLLHLVGYDHVRKNDARKMFALQEKIVELS